MHYANGRKAEKGDDAAGTDLNANPISGVVRSVGTYIHIIPLAGGYIAQCKPEECLHCDDIAAAGRALKDAEATFLAKKD